MVAGFIFEIVLSLVLLAWATSTKNKTQAQACFAVGALVFSLALTSGLVFATPEERTQIRSVLVSTASLLGISATGNMYHVLILKNREMAVSAIGTVCIGFVYLCASQIF